MGMLSRRQDSTIDTIAATRGPASLLPMWIQFLRLWKSSHKRKNWIHLRWEGAGPRIAAIISLIETCRQLQIRPCDYFDPSYQAWLAFR
jgi:hypothetical protein